MVVTPSIGIVTKENIKDLGLNMIQSGYNHTKFNGEIDIIRPFGPFTHPPNSSDFFSFWVLRQICLRWVLEQGASVVVKSFNEERIKENMEILDWELSSEESQKIDQLEQQKGFPGDMFVWEEGPYKSIEEFWDGEI